MLSLCPVIGWCSRKLMTGALYVTRAVWYITGLTTICGGGLCGGVVIAAFLSVCAGMVWAILILTSIRIGVRWDGSPRVFTAAMVVVLMRKRSVGLLWM